MACVDGQGGFNASLFAGLKSHISLREALEIEAVKCVAGDARHAFNMFATEWFAEQRRQSKDPAALGQLDAAALLEEIEMMQQAITEHEQLIAEHRIAVSTKQPSPLGPADVDATHETLAALRANLPLIQAEYARMMADAKAQENR